MQKLIDKTTASQDVRSHMDGTTRALLYRLAVETGLRAGAITVVTRENFRFADDGSAMSPLRRVIRRTADGIACPCGLPSPVSFGE